MIDPNTSVSDVEIIQAVQSSHPTLGDTPLGVLSIIAHYSRPNVYTFPRGKACTMTTYHYTVEGSTTRSPPEQPNPIRSLIGATGSNIYLIGFNTLLGWMVYSFSVQTQTFKCLYPIEGPYCSYLLSPGSIYEFHPALSFYKYDLITGMKTQLQSMVSSKQDSGYFLYNDNVYVFGGDGHRRYITACQRFDIKENKWYDISPMPSPVRGIHVTAKDGCLYIVTREGCFFTYDPEKDTWSVPELDRDLTVLSAEKLHYSGRRFTAVSKVGNSMIIREVESTTPKEPWKLVLTIEGVHHVHLTDE